MRYIIERIEDTKRTYYGPFILETHAQHVLNKILRDDTQLATYQIHVLLPEANLQKPV